MRIALANLEFPESPQASVAAAEAAIAQAADAGASLIFFPECFVPGYRALGAPVPLQDDVWLDAAHRQVAEAAGRSGLLIAEIDPALADPLLPGRLRPVVAR